MKYTKIHDDASKYVQNMLVKTIQINLSEHI